MMGEVAGGGRGDFQTLETGGVLVSKPWKNQRDFFQGLEMLGGWFSKVWKC